jgi:hypothetical protein
MEREDPWTQMDPWGYQRGYGIDQSGGPPEEQEHWGQMQLQPAESAAEATPSGSSPPGVPAGGSWGGWQPPARAFYGGGTQEQSGPKFIHDNPPAWDGKDPDRRLEPYLKLLRGWMHTTRTLKTQRGMVILNYAQGDLQLIINELDVTVLTSEDGDEKVLAHIQESYQEYLEKRLPKAMERAIFAPEGRRGKTESMIQYVARKRTLLQELSRVECPLPSQALRYIMLRDANLSERAWDTVENGQQAATS